VFALVAPEQFNRFFIRWTQGLCKHEGGEVIAIDGKSLRGSSKTQAVHLVNAWACENNLILGQLKTDKKSNEITAIPELLKQLAIKGSIITIDAMGTQKEIAQEVDNAGASYVFSLKKNHPKLFKEVFELLDASGGAKDMDCFESTETGHGRSEVRRHWITSNIGSLSQRGDWAGLCSVGKIQRVRKVQGEKPTTEQHYYLCSIEADASLLATCARKHWEVENKVHWTLDVTFGEDSCQVREETAATNLSLLRKMVLNILRQDESKGSMRSKRKRAGWNVGFLEGILGFTRA
jgi:predicted transposase YbfD/YdcC